MTTIFNKDCNNRIRRDFPKYHKGNKNQFAIIDSQLKLWRRNYADLGDNVTMESIDDFNMISKCIFTQIYHQLKYMTDDINGLCIKHHCMRITGEWLKDYEEYERGCNNETNIESRT